MRRLAAAGGSKAVKQTKRTRSGTRIKRMAPPPGMQYMTPSLYEQILRAIRAMSPAR